MNTIISFINSSLSALASSASGVYDSRTEAVEELRREMLTEKSKTFRDDKINLSRDRKAVASDINRTFHKIISQNG